MKTYWVTLYCTIPMNPEDTFNYSIEAESEEQAKTKAQQQAYDRCYNHAEHPVVNVELVWDEPVPDCRCGADSRRGIEHARWCENREGD